MRHVVTLFIEVNLTCPCRLKRIFLENLRDHIAKVWQKTSAEQEEMYCFSTKALCRKCFARAIRVIGVSRFRNNVLSFIHHDIKPKLRKLSHSAERIIGTTSEYFSR